MHIGCLDTFDDGRRKRVSRQRSGILLASIVELVRAVHGSSVVRQKREPRARAAARKGNACRPRPSKTSPHRASGCCHEVESTSIVRDRYDNENDGELRVQRSPPLGAHTFVRNGKGGERGPLSAVLPPPLPPACLGGRARLRGGRRHHTRSHERARASVRGGVYAPTAKRRRSAVATRLTIRVTAGREDTVAVDRAAVVFGAEREHVEVARAVGPRPLRERELGGSLVGRAALVGHLPRCDSALQATGTLVVAVVWIASVAFGNVAVVPSALAACWRQGERDRANGNQR